MRFLLLLTFTLTLTLPTIPITALSTTPKPPTSHPSFDLILSSGFLCFSSHAGFLHALQDRNLVPDAIIGTSSGSIAAALTAAGYCADDVSKILSKDKRSISLIRPSLTPWRGVCSTRGLVRRMRDLLPERFDQLELPLGVGVYRNTKEEENEDGDGKEHFLVTSGDLPKAVAASCAVPGIFSPVKIPGPDGVISGALDGGGVDRTGVRGWKEWRKGNHDDDTNNNRALLNLVIDLPPPEFGGKRSGLEGEGLVLDDVDIIRTKRANASFLSLRDFEGERERARVAVMEQLDGLGW